MIGTLAPPPAYGSHERESILLETATGPQISSSVPALPPSTPAHAHAHTQPQFNNNHQRQRSDEAAAVAALGSPEPSSSRHNRTHSHRRTPSASTAPIRPSPLRTSMTRQRTSSYNSATSAGSGSSPVSIPGTSSTSSPPDEVDEEEGGQDEGDELLPHNPPTPGQLDISLRAISPFSQRVEEEDYLNHHHSNSSQQQAEASSSSAPRAYRPTSPPTSSTPDYQSLPPLARQTQSGDISPPSYQLIDSNQYPAGVAEAMLEDQFSALFAAATAGANPGPGPGRASPGGSAVSYENRTMSGPDRQSSSSSSGQQAHGFGLRTMFGNMWRRPSASEDTEQGQSRQQNQPQPQP